LKLKNNARLNRYEIDAVARAILSGERNLKPEFNQCADQAASLITQFLYAQRVPGRFRTKGLRWNAPFRKEKVLSQLGREKFQQIFSRVRKLVSLYQEKNEHK
jgi:hypothetical protein